MRPLFMCNIFFFAVCVCIHYTPLSSSLYQGIPVFLVIETLAPNVIFKIYKVPVRCQTEISVWARPFRNFLKVSNIKVGSDYINNTMRGKTTLGDSLLSFMGLGLSLEIINQKKNDNVSHSKGESIYLLLQAFIIILLLQTLPSYSYCGALVPSEQRDSLLNKADHYVFSNYQSFEES